VYVEFDVDDPAVRRYRQAFRKDQKDDGPEPPLKDLKIPVAVALSGEEGFPHKGVIDFADNEVDPNTGTMLVRGVLPNPSRILDAGAQARVRIPVSDPHKAMLISERAIATDQGRKVVYVVNDKDVVERRFVTVDRLIDGMQVIKEGLKPDDRVIVNGIQRVRDGMKVQPQRDQ
jgi:multidrug efflux system membrane fusion protein